jgi:hypothetical protein
MVNRAHFVILVLAYRLLVSLSAEADHTKEVEKSLVDCALPCNVSELQELIEVCSFAIMHLGLFH